MLYVIDLPKIILSILMNIYVDNHNLAADRLCSPGGEALACNI